MAAIAYDATAAVHQAAGIGRYARELLAALARRHDDFSYRVVYAARGAHHGELPVLDGRFLRRPIPTSDRVLNAIWQRARLPLPIQLTTGTFDLFHSPDFTLPPAAGRPTVLTVHDLAFLTVPETAYPTLRAYLQAVVPRSVRRATHIIAVSEQTRRDVIERLGTDPGRVTTVHEGVGREFQPPVDRAAAGQQVRALGIDGPFILAVGTLEPRKNYRRLLGAFARLADTGRQLVIAGREGWLYDPIYHRQRELGLDRKVKFVVPSGSQLVALYGACDLFVYPSLYEGFGLPPLEALACGAPVVCSGTSSLPEVVGEAAVLVDPEDESDIAHGIEAVLSDPGLAECLRAAGPRQAAPFTWDRAAAETVEIYRQVLNHA